MRCVILYMDAELAEGFGESWQDAQFAALEQIPVVYKDYSNEELTFEYHQE